MTLPELLHNLSTKGLIPASRVKDLNTSIRYLAQALGTSPELLTNLEALEVQYKAVLKSYFTAREHSPGRSTIKNTLTNLSFLFRVARTSGLLHPSRPQPTNIPVYQSYREMRLTSPYRHRVGKNQQGNGVPVRQWPDDIRHTWEQYRLERSSDIRQTTLQICEGYLVTYIGFGLKYEQPPITAWSQLFEIDRLRRFIAWHVTKMKTKRITDMGIRTGKLLVHLAKYGHRPELSDLSTFVRKLKIPEPMHNKQDATHTIDPKDLEQVGLTLLQEARTVKPGLYAGLKHQAGLILRLLVRVPLRARNICEMQLGHHLFKDQDGIWQLCFQGEDLKIRQRHGRINVFARPFPSDLIEHLEEYLENYRPLIAHSQSNQRIFYTRKGEPLTQQALHRRLSYEIWSRLHKRFYPHLIRTIMADTMLLKGIDISTVAFLLNDTPEVVLRRYHELRANDHIKKADDFMHSLLGAS